MKNLLILHPILEYTLVSQYQNYPGIVLSRYCIILNKYFNFQPISSILILICIHFTNDYDNTRLYLEVFIKHKLTNRWLNCIL